MVRDGGGWVFEGGEGVWGDGEGVWRVMRGEEGGGEVVERVEEACERERGGEEGGGRRGGGGEFGKSGKREKENGVNLRVCRCRPVFLWVLWGCCAWVGGREGTLMEVWARGGGFCCHLVPGAWLVNFFFSCLCFHQLTFTMLKHFYCLPSPS